MAKYAAAVIALFAIVAVSTASPIGLGMGGVVSKNHHVSSHIISPYMGLGLGYGMMGMGGIGGGIGHSISHSSSVGHIGPHLGLGMIGMKGLGMGMMGMKGLYGMYPGGIGMGYGLMG